MLEVVDERVASQVLSASSRSTTQTRRGRRRSLPRFRTDHTATSCTARLPEGTVPGARELIIFTSGRQLAILTHLRLFRFNVSGGSFSATVSARDSIAVHTGAMGVGSGSGGSGNVVINFAETATTTLGEVR